MSEKQTAHDLWEKARGVYGKERRSLLHQVIELADAENDVELGFSARHSFVQASHNEPDHLMLIAHYGWMLARVDEEPDRFNISLWEYKWVANAAPGFAGVSREQLLELVDDLAARFKAAGASGGPAGVARCEVLASLGEMDELAREFEIWRNIPKVGPLNDCSTCDVASEIFFLIELGRHREAIDAGAPVISGGSRCRTQPHYAYANLLTAARAVRDRALADMLRENGLALIGHNADFTLAFGPHLRHLAITGDVDAGMDLLRRMAPIATGDDSSMLAFARGARLMLSAAETKGVEGLAGLHAQFDGMAEDLAARFDARNGNGRTSDQIAFDDAELAAGW